MARAESTGWLLKMISDRQNKKHGQAAGHPTKITQQGCGAPRNPAPCHQLRLKDGSGSVEAGRAGRMPSSGAEVLLEELRKSRVIDELLEGMTADQPRQTRKTMFSSFDLSFLINRIVNNDNQLTAKLMMTTLQTWSLLRF